MKDKKIAVLLSFLLPGCGHLYLGRWTDGVIYIIASLFLWGLIITRGPQYLIFDNPRSVMPAAGLGLMYFFSALNVLWNIGRPGSAKNKESSLPALPAKVFIVPAVLIILLLSTNMVYRLIKYPHPRNHPRLGVVPVSGTRETRVNQGLQVGGWCWLGGATMLLKHHDPSITFSKVLLYKESGSSFDFFFPGKLNERTLITGREYHLDTSSQMLAAKNLGYQVHLRLKDPRLVTGPEKWQIQAWIKTAQELRADYKTVFFTLAGEIKHQVAQGRPVFTDSIPCGNDYNVIEGYEGSKYFVITPEPEAFGLTEYKGTCNIPVPNFYRTLWYSKEWESKSNEEMLSFFRWHAYRAPINMRAFVQFVREYPDTDVGVTFNQLYIVRVVLADWLEELGYQNLAKGYRQAAELIIEGSRSSEEQAGFRKDVLTILPRWADIEESIYQYWPRPTVSKNTDFLEYGGIVLESEKKTDLSVSSTPVELKEGKVIYEAYNIKTSEPVKLTFKIGVLMPANMLNGRVSIVRVEDGQPFDMDVEDLGETISTQIDGSGLYALVVYPEQVTDIRN